MRPNEVPEIFDLKLGMYKRPAILAPAGLFVLFDQRTLIYFIRAITIAIVISCESPGFRLIPIMHIPDQIFEIHDD